MSSVDQYQAFWEGKVDHRDRQVQNHFLTGSMWLKLSVVSNSQLQLVLEAPGKWSHTPR